MGKANKSKNFRNWKPSAMEETEKGFVNVFSSSFCYEFKRWNGIVHRKRLTSKASFFWINKRYKSSIKILPDGSKIVNVLLQTKFLKNIE